MNSICDKSLRRTAFAFLNNLNQNKILINDNKKNTTLTFLSLAKEDLKYHMKGLLVLNTA